MYYNLSRFIFLGYYNLYSRVSFLANLYSIVHHFLRLHYSQAYLIRIIEIRTWCFGETIDIRIRLIFPFSFGIGLVGLSLFWDWYLKDSSTIKKYILQQSKTSYGSLYFQFTIVFIFMYVHIVNHVYLIMQNVTIYQVASSIPTVSNAKER